MTDIIRTINFYEEYAKEFTLKTWGQKLNIPVITNNRGKRAGAFYYRLRPEKTSSHIALNFKVIDTHEEAINTLKHELCHWYCFENGLQHKDGSYDFEKKLKEVGARSTHFGYGSNERSEFVQSAVLEGTMTLKGPESMKYKKTDAGTLITKMQEKKHPFITKGFPRNYLSSPTEVYYEGEFIGYVFRYGNKWLSLDTGLVCYTSRKRMAMELMAKKKGM